MNIAVLAILIFFIYLAATGRLTNLIVIVTQPTGGLNALTLPNQKPYSGGPVTQGTSGGN